MGTNFFNLMLHSIDNWQEGAPPLEYKRPPPKHHLCRREKKPIPVIVADVSERNLKFTID